MSDVLLLTTTHEHINVGRPTKTYIQQFSVDTGCSLEDLIGTDDERESSESVPSARFDDHHIVKFVKALDVYEIVLHKLKWL